MTHTPDIYDSSSYRTVYDIAIIGYVIAKRDMAGVLPILDCRLSSAIRTSSKRVKDSLIQLANCGEIIVAPDWSHIWWERGIYYTLYRGRYSGQQMSSVVKTLNQWNAKQVFGVGFMEQVKEIYINKYGIDIPVGVSVREEKRTSEPTSYSLDLTKLKESAL